MTPTWSILIEMTSYSSVLKKVFNIWVPFYSKTTEIMHFKGYKL